MQGARKAQQIGMDAATQVLLAALEGAMSPERAPVAIVYVNCGVGNSADATIVSREKFNRPIPYIACVDDPSGLLWVC